MIQKLLRRIHIWHEKGNKSKQTHTKGKQKHPKTPSTSRFIQTTPNERETMLSLRREGLSIHAIAETLGRSSRTIYDILTSRGTQPLPPRGGASSLQGIGDVARDRRRRRRRGSGGSPNDSTANHDLRRRLETIVTEGARDVFRLDPELARQVIAAQLGLKLPKKSVDDFVLEELKEDPRLRKEWAEEHLKQMKYRGRTEMEIFSEGLEMFFEFLDRCGRSTNWPDAVAEMARSGEIHKTMQAVMQGIQAAKTPSPPSAQAAQVAPSDRSQSDPQIAPAHSEAGLAVLKRLPRHERLAVWKKVFDSPPPPSTPPTPDKRMPEMSPGDTQATEAEPTEETG